MLLLTLIACMGDGTTEVLADFAAAVDTVDVLVGDHAAAVEVATAIEDVTALEASFRRNGRSPTRRSPKRWTW